MITRRSVLAAGGISLLVAHRLSRGQAAATIRRVGWVSLGSITSSAEAYAAFKQGMHDLGWLESKNVEYRTAYADGDVNHLDLLASGADRAESRRDRGRERGRHACGAAVH